MSDKPSGRQPTGQHLLVNWATEVETTEPQLWKCERLTIAVLEQICVTLGGDRLIALIERIYRTLSLNAAKLWV